MESEKVAAAVTYNPETDRFLLMKRSATRTRFPEHWEFPSGFIEEGEYLREAALRELEEETGLLGTAVKKGESFPIQVPDVEVFPVLVKVDTEEVELSEEHSGFEWVELDEIENFETVPKLRNDLEAVGVL